MNIVTVKKGKVELRNDNGTVIRTFGRDAVNANLNANQSLVVVVTEKGKVELYKADNGSMIRSFGNGDAVSATWTGKDIAVQIQSGKTEIRSESGTLIRTI